jgi:hypothetical protein
MALRLRELWKLLDGPACAKRRSPDQRHSHDGRASMNVVEIAKGIVSIVRDGLITLVLILLLVAPATVNDRLMSAGFKKANIAGFDWEATVKDNNEKLQVATNTIDSLQDQVSKTEAALKTSEHARQTFANQVAATMPGTPIAEAAAAPPPVQTNEIVQQNSQVVKTSELRANTLRQQIQLNNNLLAKVAPAARQ